MKTVRKQVVIIGGGPAGLAAACMLKEKGVSDLLILEREHQLGGILRQCIHDGFGLIRFGEALSGPEYAERFIERVDELSIEYHADTTVFDIAPDRIVTAVSRDGLVQYKADAVILTMGCRERTRGALSIPGSRPAGIYTAGVAQTYMNLKNTMVGKEVVILGSGDIGLIMARRLTLEGAKVLAVFEIQPYANGLPRNVEQCLRDYDIPLYVNHTVTQIKGRARLEAVVVSQVDERQRPIPGTETEYACDTLILSVGLIPENELSRKAGVQLDFRTKGPLVDEFCQTSVSGIFAAGNVLHVHDLVDFVSLEAEQLAQSVYEYLKSGLPHADIILETDPHILNMVPQRISGNCDVDIFYRVSKPLSNCRLCLYQSGEMIISQTLKNPLPAEMKKIHLPCRALVSKATIKAVIEPC